MKEKLLVFRLNRWFNLFRPRVYLPLAAFFVFLAASSVGIVLSEKQTLLFQVSFSLASLAFLAWLLPLFFPKTLTVSDGALKFAEYVRVRRRGISFEIREGLALWTRVEYTVKEIHSVEFRQNALEKRFDFGHISFSGWTTFEAKRDLEHIRERCRFTVYGIPHFAEFQAEFQELTEKKPSYEEV